MNFKKICQICGDDFLTEWPIAKYCKKCTEDPEGSTNKFFKEEKCPTCGKLYHPFRFFKQRARKGNLILRRNSFPRKTCSKECANALKSIVTKNKFENDKKLRKIGDKKILQSGYVSMWCGEQWRAEHVVAMEEMLGRKIEKGELVHHRNGERDDNEPGNLQLLIYKKHSPGMENQYLKDINRLLGIIAKQNKT